MTYKRFLQLGRPLGLKKLGEVILNNMVVTAAIIKQCGQNGWAYRISSSLFSLITFEEASIKLENLPNWSQIQVAIKLVADTRREFNVVLSAHPSEYTILESLKPQVVENAIKDLQFHGWLMDQFGASRDLNSPINIHVICSDKTPEVIVDRFMAAFNRCDDSVKSRLTLENNDKGFWNVKRLYDYFYIYCGDKYGKRFSLTFDNLHDRILTSNLPEKEAFYLCASTWPKNMPLRFHYSESASGSNPRAHADMPTGKPDTHGYNGDIIFEVELKSKDDAIKSLERL